MPRHPAPSTRFRLLLAASAVVTSALIGLLWTSGVHSAAPRQDAGASATAYAGAIRTTVSVVSELHGHLQLRVHLERSGRSLSARYVSLTVRPLPPLMAGRRAYRLRPGAGTFAVGLSSPVAGAWETDVRVVQRSEAAHFLLRVSPNPRLVASTIDPLLTRRGPVREVTLPWGAGTATVDVAPGSFAQENTFTVQLEGQRRLPPTVQLSLTMEEMDMGVMRLTAKPIRPGHYLARGSFSMGGTWRVDLAAAGLHAYALTTVIR